MAHVDIEISPHELGFHARANRWIRVHPSPVEDAGRALARQPQISSAVTVSGTDNLHAVAHCRTHDELFRFTSDTVGALAGLQTLEVSPLLHQVKQASTRVSDDLLMLKDPPRRT